MYFEHWGFNFQNVERIHYNNKDYLKKIKWNEYLMYNFWKFQQLKIVFTVIFFQYYEYKRKNYVAYFVFSKVHMRK